MDHSMISDTMMYIATNDNMQQVVVMVQAALTLLGGIFAMMSKNHKEKR